MCPLKPQSQKMVIFPVVLRTKASKNSHSTKGLTSKTEMDKALRIESYHEQFGIQF